MRVADYLFSGLADAGLRHVFMVTGGGAMFLNEAVRRESRLSWTCHHHEQAAAMAAEGYARVTGVSGDPERHHGPGRHQRAERRLRGLDRLDPHDRRLGSGEARDVHELVSRPRPAPARRSGDGHRGDGDRGDQARAAGHRPCRRAVGARGGALARDSWATGARVARRAHRRAVVRRGGPTSLAAFVPPAPTADPSGCGRQCPTSSIASRRPNDRWYSPAPESVWHRRTMRFCA